MPFRTAEFNNFDNFDEQMSTLNPCFRTQKRIQGSN